MRQEFLIRLFGCVGRRRAEAVAFCPVIGPGNTVTVHKVSSKNIAAMFQSVVDAYQEAEGFETVAPLICEAEHFDASMNASQEEGKLN